MKKNIGVIWGDCSSPEIVREALRILNKIALKYDHEFVYTDIAMGGEAIDKYGEPLPEHELEKCLNSDSVLLGAIGGPKWEGMPGHLRPEKGLLKLRSKMKLYSNLRPAKIWPQLQDASPLKKSIVDKGHGTLHCFKTCFQLYGSKRGWNFKYWRGVYPVYQYCDSYRLEPDTDAESWKLSAESNSTGNSEQRICNPVRSLPYVG